MHIATLRSNRGLAPGILGALVVAAGIVATFTAAPVAEQGQTAQATASTQADKAKPAEAFGSLLQTDEKRGYRRVPATPGSAISSLLRPTDEVLEVVDINPPGASGPPPGGQTLVEYLTKQATVVAELQVVNVTGRLASTGDKIESVVTASVIDVRKNDPSGQPRTGEQLAFAVEGGELRINSRQKVIYFRHGERLFQQGRQYLVFLRGAAGSFSATSAESLEVVGKGLSPLRKNSALAWISNLADKDAVLQEIQTYSLVRPQGK